MNIFLCVFFFFYCNIYDGDELASDELDGDELAGDESAGDESAAMNRTQPYILLLLKLEIIILTKKKKELN
jgi:hypothetical protein